MNSTSKSVAILGIWLAVCVLSYNPKVTSEGLGFLLFAVIVLTGVIASVGGETDDHCCAESDCFADDDEDDNEDE